MTTALITGITGQDGSYLAELLLTKDYRVVGLCRGTKEPTANLKDCIASIELCYGDLRDTASLNNALHKYRPDEIYNLGAVAFVPPSWTEPTATMDINVNGLLRILDLVERIIPKCKVYQASSTDMFGNAQEYPDEQTNAQPMTPYAVSKLAAHKLCSVYRKKGLFVTAGILGNHESPRRGMEMVTRKISNHVAGWVVGAHQAPLILGNMEAKRDWGYAKEYVEVMHRMMQLDEPDDFIIGSERAHSVEDFFETAVEVSGLSKKYLKHVKVDESLVRKVDPGLSVVIGDTTKAQKKLGWSAKTTFEELVKMMVTSDVEKLSSRVVFQ